MASRTKSTVTVGKSGYATGQKRTEAEWDTLFASKVLPALKGGSTMTEQRKLYGRSEMLRQAARRAGFASIADAVAGRGGTFKPIRVKGVKPAIVARNVDASRQSGGSVNTLRLQTGLARDELSALLTKHGYEPISGRVITSTRGKARLEKAQAEAKAAEAKSAARKSKAAARKAAKAVTVAS